MTCVTFVRDVFRNGLRTTEAILSFHVLSVGTVVAILSGGNRRRRFSAISFVSEGFGTSRAALLGCGCKSKLRKGVILMERQSLSSARYA